MQAIARNSAGLMRTDPKQPLLTLSISLELHVYHAIMAISQADSSTCGAGRILYHPNKTTSLLGDAASRGHRQNACEVRK
jgi:hypothetical protein